MNDPRPADRTLRPLAALSRPTVLLSTDQGLFVVCDDGASIVRVSPTGEVVPLWTSDGARQCVTSLAVFERFLYAACDSEDLVIAMDLRTRDAKVHRLEVNSMPAAVAIAPDGSAFIANQGTSTVSHVDAGGNLVSAFAKLPAWGHPFDIVTDHAGYAYAANRNDGSVSRISGAGQVIDLFYRFPEQVLPGSIEFGDGGHLVVSCNDSCLWHISLGGELLDVEYIERPSGFATRHSRPDVLGRRFVAEYWSNTVWMTGSDGRLDERPFSYAAARSLSRDHVMTYSCAVSQEGVVYAAAYYDDMVVSAQA